MRRRLDNWKIGGTPSGRKDGALRTHTRGVVGRNGGALTSYPLALEKSFFHEDEEQIAEEGPPEQIFTDPRNENLRTIIQSIL